MRSSRRGSGVTLCRLQAHWRSSSCTGGTELGTMIMATASEVDMACLRMSIGISKSPWWKGHEQELSEIGVV